MHPALLAADWPAPAAVRGFVTLRHGAGVSEAPFDQFNLGARCGDAPDAVARNRAQLARIGGLPSAPHWLRQVHGTGVWRAEEKHPHPPFGHLLPQAGEGSEPPPLPQMGEGSEPPPFPQMGEGSEPPPFPQMGEGSEPPPLSPMGDGSELPPLPLAGEGWGEGARSAEPEADAAVTSVPGAVLAVLTADCLPVLICADDGSEVAAAHAGWRGLAAGVLEATVAAMRTPPPRLLAWLGPAAGPRHYEVGAEVHEAFVTQDRDAAGAFAATRPGHWRVDLYALARRRLRQAGVAAERIHGGGSCTIAEPQRFYSHRRDARTGRMATVAWIDTKR